MSIVPRIFQSLDRDLARAFRSFERDPFFRSATANWPATLSPATDRQSLIGPTQQRSIVPDVDVSETKDSFVVEAEVPGFPKDKISIEFKDDTLILRGKFETERTEGQPPAQEFGGEQQESARKPLGNTMAEAASAQPERKYWSVERQVGSFERSFAFPPSKVDTENIKASFQDGLLTVTLPKFREELEEKAAKKIAIE